LEPFQDTSYLAQQIVIDKTDHWEYKLTTELIRTMAGPIFQRWKMLEKGLYTQPSTLVPFEDMQGWLVARHSELIPDHQDHRGDTRRI
jgi:hypothetical protein